MLTVTLELTQAQINIVIEALKAYRNIEAGRRLQNLDKALGQLEDYS